MHQHQHVDVIGNRLAVLRQHPHLELLPQLVDDQPGGLHAQAHATGKTAVDRRAGEDTDDQPLGMGELVDELGQVVFEKAFPFRLEEGNGLAVAIQLADQAEIEVFRTVAERNSLQAEADRVILGLGEGFGIDLLQAELVAGQGDIFVEQTGDPVGVGGQAGSLADRLPAQVELEGHRLVESGEDVAGPL